MTLSTKCFVYNPGSPSYTETSVLTQSEVKQKFEYNPITGVVSKNGIEAGYKDTHGYIKIMVNNKNYYAHRIAWLYMTGENVKQIDHKNRIRHDNKWTNLRSCTQSENAQNMSVHKSSKTGIKGVTWHPRTDSYLVQIKLNYKNHFLGYHEDFFEACCARKSTERKLHAKD